MVKTKHFSGPWYFSAKATFVRKQDKKSTSAAVIYSHDYGIGFKYADIPTNCRAQG